jgi:hypothetical protein
MRRSLIIYDIPSEFLYYICERFLISFFISVPRQSVFASHCLCQTGPNQISINYPFKPCWHWQAYDQRDEAQGKIGAMKEKNEKDARNFGEEMKELQRTLDHDEKLKNFLFHKVDKIMQKSVSKSQSKELTIEGLPELVQQFIRGVHIGARARHVLTLIWFG